MSTSSEHSPVPLAALAANEEVIAAEPLPSEAPTPASAAGAPPRRVPMGNRRVNLLQALVGLVFLGIWQLAASFKLINPLLFSDPYDIIRRIVVMLAGERVYSRTIYDHLSATFQEMAVGYVAGAILGVAIGYVLARSAVVSRIVEPYILALYSIPKIALAPLFILLLGIGFQSKVGVVLMEVVFVVFFNTYSGIKNINEEYVNLARIMGASNAQITRRIILPAAMPSIMLGLKMGVPFAMIGAIVGEFIAATMGLGWLIQYSGANFDASALFATVAFLVAIVWILGQALGLVERRVLRWRPAQQEVTVQV